MKVLVFGSLNIDYVYHVDHIVSPGETETTTSYSVNCGGKGLNQSVALGRSGAQEQEQMYGMPEWLDRKVLNY